MLHLQIRYHASRPQNIWLKNWMAGWLFHRRVLAHRKMLVRLE
jgi:hypothetical protein